MCVFRCRRRGFDFQHAEAQNTHTHGPVLFSERDQTSHTWYVRGSDAVFYSCCMYAYVPRYSEYMTLVGASKLETEHHSTTNHGPLKYNIPTLPNKRHTTTECVTAFSYRFIHEPCQAPDAVFRGGRLVLSLASRCCWRCIRYWPSCLRCCCPCTTLSKGASLPTTTCSTPPCTATSTTTTVAHWNVGSAVEVMANGTIVLLVVRAPSAALFAGAGRGRIVTAAAAVVAVVDGAIMVGTPCAVCVWHLVKDKSLLRRESGQTQAHFYEGLKRTKAARSRSHALNKHDIPTEPPAINHGAPGGPLHSLHTLHLCTPPLWRRLTRSLSFGVGFCYLGITRWWSLA